MPRVVDALRRCAVELRVENRTMPRIVLIEADKEEARVADVGSWGKIYAEYIPSLGEAIYMAWVVGEPTEADLAHIFVSILNNFRSGSSEELIH